MTSFQEAYDVLPIYQINQAQAGADLTSTKGTPFKALSHVDRNGSRCIVIPGINKLTLDGQQGRISEDEWNTGESSSKTWKKQWIEPLKEYASNYHAQLEKKYASDYSTELENEIQASLRLTQEERLARINNYPSKPEKITINTVGFKRNPNIIAERLNLANGICGDCESEAPFIKKSNDTPYLEVHHKTPLAEDGEDTIENTIALCPNCHRKRHFGKTS